MRQRTRLLLLALVLAPPSALAQQVAPSGPAASPQPAPTVSAADYARAEKFLPWNTAPLVSGATVRVTWLPDDKFWYRNSTPQGYEFVLVDAVHHTRTRAFDQDRLATSLSAVAGRTYDAWHSPFVRFTFSADGRSITFETDDTHRTFTCDVAGHRCRLHTAVPDLSNSVVSPDGKLAAFIRNDNLWVRDLATGTDTPAHHRWREGFWLRDRQRRLDHAATGRFSLWSPRLEEDRDLPARPARRRRDVPGRDPRRPPGARGVEISAAGRQQSSPRSSG